MISRSHIHMLTVAAARLEASHADPKLIVNLREAAGFKSGKKVRQERETTQDAIEDDKRIERHRTAFNLLPNGSDKERLKKAMLQRAYDLLWDGDPIGCDAITEFLPSDDVMKMLDAWSEDQFGEKPRSKWYGGDA